MTAAHARQSPTPIATRPRKIVRRTRGSRHGPIARLMSPGDLGQLLKPFVFLDLFDMETASFPGIGLHPHSGIATVTYLFEGSVRYEDTTGATGVLPAGGVEWFKAAPGAGHGGGARGQGPFPRFPLSVPVAPDRGTRRGRKRGPRASPRGGGRPTPGLRRNPPRRPAF